MALRSLLRRSLLDTPLEPLARALYTALAPTQAARYDRQLNAVIRRVPQPIPALPVAKDPQLPGLVLGIEVATEVVRVGDPITITLFLINRAAAPADDLVLTLPVPDGARALTNGKPTPQLRSWSWNLGTLPGQQSVSVTATLQLTRMPQGEALLLTPEATARGLAAPVRAEGGALVDERVPQALPQGDGGDSVAPATTIATPAEDPPTPFLPSKPVVLRSPRGRVAISVPGDASKQPLQLRYRFADAVLPELLAARQPRPRRSPTDGAAWGSSFSMPVTIRAARCISLIARSPSASAIPTSSCVCWASTPVRCACSGSTRPAAARSPMAARDWAPGCQSRPRSTWWHAP